MKRVTKVSLIGALLMGISVCHTEGSFNLPHTSNWFHKSTADEKHVTTKGKRKRSTTSCMPRFRAGFGNQFAHRNIPEDENDFLDVEPVFDHQIGYPLAFDEGAPQDDNDKWSFENEEEAYNEQLFGNRDQGIAAQLGTSLEYDEGTDEHEEEDNRNDNEEDQPYTISIGEGDPSSSYTISRHTTNPLSFEEETALFEDETLESEEEEQPYAGSIGGQELTTLNSQLGKPLEFDGGSDYGEGMNL